MVFYGDWDNFISGEVQFNSVLPTPNALCRCVTYISLVIDIMNISSVHLRPKSGVIVRGCTGAKCDFSS